MREWSRSKFFLSIMTAIVTGVGVAYAGIGVVTLIAKPELATNTFSAVAAVSSSVSSAVSSKVSSVSLSFPKNVPALGHIFSQTLAYEAKPVEEDVEDDITFTGENLTAANNSSPALITARAYSVQSLDHDNILVQKNADTLMPIASVTKLITAVVAEKLFDPEETVTITQNVLNTEGTTGNFRLGEKYKIKEILYPLLLVSSNDAAEAISQGYDAKHGKGKFIKAMNDWVQSIGAYRTYFKDASGLSPQNVSTAHDLAIISKSIKQTMPEIFDITLTKAKTIRTHTWLNPTHFLSLSSYTGGKNGYTTEAGLTNVSLFTLGSPQRLYSVIILGGKNRDRDTLAVLNEAVK